MLKFLGRLIFPKKRRRFLAWQIELTTRCPLRCKMCIRAGSTAWRENDMPFEEFEKILSYLKDVDTVILEGWGESLLYGSLIECISLAKRTHCQVGFVTSGKGLDASVAHELCKAGLDFIGFSLAGATPSTHEAIRINSVLDEIREAVHSIQEEKSRLGIEKPSIHIVCLMLKDNVREVPLLPSLAHQWGIGTIILTNICHVVTGWQYAQAVFSCDKGSSEAESYVRQAMDKAEKLRIKMKIPSLSAIKVAVCEEDPLNNLYISTDGEVSPCVYLNPPLVSPFRRIFCGEQYTVEKLTFGNIFETNFSKIWNDKAYIDFRNAFLKRKWAMRAQLLGFKQSIDEPLPPPPPACATCHKILGF